MADKSQYAAAAHVPLIKSPSLRVPRAVDLPPDIHPLPDSVTPYFVYPFTLEPHILTLEAARRTTLAGHTARREALLSARADERERRRREALRRVAPGWDGGGAALVPTPSTVRGVGAGGETGVGVGVGVGVGEVGGGAGVGVGRTGGGDAMEELVEGLERLDASSTSR